jgi:ribose transport system substrate-binding protein
MDPHSGARRFGALLFATAGLGVAVTACGSSSATPTKAASLTPASSGGGGCPTVVAADTKAVYAAEHPSSSWNGPTTGPKAVVGKDVAFVGGTLQNGGVLGVLKGFRQATAVLGWKVKVFDGQDTTPGENSALSAAIDSKPAAIAIVGFPSILVESEIKQANAKHIPLIGWHATPVAGPGGGLFTNVTSLNTAIGKIAGQYAVVAQKGDVHAVIMTDPSIPETLQKAQGMEAAIKACASSSVLGVDDVPFEDIDTQSPTDVSSALQKYSSKLTDVFAINDLAFDASVPSLESAGVSATGIPHMIAAGDGSSSAFARIREGKYQTATVAEPLLMHGWQVADEMNRALAHAKPSGYVTTPHLVTAEDVNRYDGQAGIFNPPNGYASQYRKIWGR